MRNRKSQKNSKTIQKYHYGSFQAKIDWKMPRKREYKNYRYISSYPTRNLKFQKNSNKIQKIKIYHYGFISSQNGMEMAEQERK